MPRPVRGHVCNACGTQLRTWGERERENVLRRALIDNDPVRARALDKAWCSSVGCRKWFHHIPLPPELPPEPIVEPEA